MDSLLLEQVYSKNSINYQKMRYINAINGFEKQFYQKPCRFFSAPGRTEICGNHTDHNNGNVLVAGVSLDVIAAVIPTDDGIIQVKSEGYRLNTVDLSDLAPDKHEYGTSLALIRGVAAGLSERGYKIGGFKAYMISNVLKGSGLSSSAAFEIVVGSILNGLYNNGEIDPITIAKVSQYAENNFFGKPSGLMDQMASSVGSFISIDFKDTENPIVKKIDFDFQSCEHSLCIVDTKGNHANLTPEYAAIPTEMKKVAGYFNAECLRSVTKSEIIDNYAILREKYSDRAVLRALHFMDDNKRVLNECEALSKGDFNEFLRLVNLSGNSSYMYLQNLFASSAPQEQGLCSALYIAKEVLKDRGACRVHGGGFAGTIQAFVPNNLLDEFKTRIEKVFGKNTCYILSVRPVGGTEIKL